jgi:hypothetical protein
MPHDTLLLPPTFSSLAAALVFFPGYQGDSFRENCPPGPVKHLQKLLIKGSHGLPLKRVFGQTMTAFSFLFGICNLWFVICNFPRGRHPIIPLFQHSIIPAAERSGAKFLSFQEGEIAGLIEVLQFFK